jgi:predicted nucleic acid-binding protein
MILTDAGPWWPSWIGANQITMHVPLLEAIRGPMVTTWPAFTEAIYLLGDAGGWSALEALSELIRGQNLVADGPTADDSARLRALMGKYRDLPMDLADASLVLVAEDRNVTDVFSLDRHFSVYRIHGRRRFRVWPGVAL